MNEESQCLGFYPYKPPEGRAAIEEMMAEPIESQIKWRKEQGLDYSPVPRGDLEYHLDPRLGASAEFLKDLKTPQGNRQAVETIIDTWINEHLALDRKYQSEILELDRKGGRLYTLQELFDKRKPNQQAIINLFAARKRLLTLPGISFTQVNMTQGPQQINNGPNGTEEPEGEVSNVGRE